MNTILTDRTSWVLLLILMLLAASFWLIQPFAIIVFTSLLLTILLTDSVNFFNQWLPRGTAAALVLIGFIILIGSLLIALSNTFIPSLAELLRDIPHIISELRHLVQLNISNQLSSQFEDYLHSMAVISLDVLRSSVTLAFMILDKFINLLLIIFITFYLLKDGLSIKLYLICLFPDRDFQRVHMLFNSIITALSKYVRGQLLICLLTGSIVFVYFSCRSLPYASVFAVLSAVAELLPVVGPTAASLLGSLYCLVHSFALSLETLLFYLVLTQLTHNVVYPYMIGRSIQLHPLAILLSIILGGNLLGPLGMFIAVPFMIIARHIIHDAASFLAPPQD